MSSISDTHEFMLYTTSAGATVRSCLRCGFLDKIDCSDGVRILGPDESGTCDEENVRKVLDG